jgi:hypothetical protein
VLGEAAPAAEERLAQTVRDLEDEEREAKLAVVTGPVGAPSMTAYARRLRARIGYAGTLVVTAPGRPVRAVGPLPPAEITRRLRAGGVGAVADPTERVVLAARLVAAERPLDSGASTRQLTALIGLAILGAGWAVAWGLRREGRGRRAAVSDARNRGRVQLDALAAQAARLRAGPDGPSSALTQAEEEARAARRALEGAGDLAAVAAAEARLQAGLAALARARSAAGHEQPADPYSGLCRVDPAHGPAAERAVTAEGGPAIPACAACAAAAAAGAPRARRRVAVRGVPLPYDQAGAATPPPGAASRS